MGQRCPAPFLSDHFGHLNIYQTSFIRPGVLARGFVSRNAIYSAFGYKSVSSYDFPFRCSPTRPLNLSGKSSFFSFIPRHDRKQRSALYKNNALHGTIRTVTMSLFVLKRAVRFVQRLRSGNGFVLLKLTLVCSLNIENWTAWSVTFRIN